MTTNFVPGKGASFSIAETAYAFKRWICKMFAKLGETPNFPAGCMTRVAGLPDVSITASGAHDVGNMPFTVNTSYTPILGITTEVSLTAPTICESITETADVLDPVSTEVVFLGNGTFTPSIT